MKNTIVIFVLMMINVFSIGCTSDPSIAAKGNKYYQKYKRNFDKKFVDHFPARIGLSTTNTPVFSSMEQKKNNFSLMLYQYDVKPEEVNEVKGKFSKVAIARYKSSDSCLLIVNGFETIETDENQIMPVIDSTLLNRNCYSSKYPIPNFINYKDYNEDRSLRLDDTFVIYVLESKKVNSWLKEFNMGPDEQMPDNWKNGYSKGVAISMEKQTVIYWTVIW